MPTLKMTLVCDRVYSEILDDAPVSPACLVEAQAAVAMLRHWEFVSVEAVDCRQLLHDGALAWLVSFSLQTPESLARRGRRDGFDATTLEGSLRSALREIFSRFQVTSCTLTSEPEAPRPPERPRRRTPRFVD